MNYEEEQYYGEPVCPHCGMPPSEHFEDDCVEKCSCEECDCATIVLNGGPCLDCRAGYHDSREV